MFFGIIKSGILLHKLDYLSILFGSADGVGIRNEKNWFTFVMIDIFLTISSVLRNRI